MDFPIGVIGLNHKSAPLQFREVFAKVCQKRLGTDLIFESDFCYVLLSTCNRTEIYFSSHALPSVHGFLLETLRQDIKEEFEHQLYTYFGQDCFYHLAKVTAGLDSALIFETEIQGQVKQAYELATANQILSHPLHYLFQKSLKIGKELRSAFPSIPNIFSLEETIFQLSQNYLGTLNEKAILFVGASEINCKIFNFFKKKQLPKMTFCNRSHKRLENLQIDGQFSVLNWKDLNRWNQFDLIFFATKSTEFLITSAEPSPLLKLVFDLSVPRNVEPQIGKIRGISLLNIDQLNGLINKKRAMKLKEIAYLENKILFRAVQDQISNYLAREKNRHLWFSKAVSSL